MKHQTLDQMHAIAEVQAHPAQIGMSRTQRLERWAKLLEDQPHRILTALEGTEHRPPPERATMRAEGSPISVAFNDRILHAEGLTDDSYGETKRFFELTDNQLHEIVCYCHVGASMQASRAAHCVRTAIEGRGFFAGGCENSCGCKAGMVLTEPAHWQMPVGSMLRFGLNEIVQNLTHSVGNQSEDFFRRSCAVKRGLLQAFTVSLTSATTLSSLSRISVAVSWPIFLVARLAVRLSTHAKTLRTPDLTIEQRQRRCLRAVAPGERSS